MAAFSELIRNFDKIRDFMRDFYIYGSKRRGDFDGKSARTYDNEKRRIESYLGPYVQWNHDAGGKRTFVSLNSAQIKSNPLYAAWKSKAFTDGDIMLHFALLDVLRDGGAKHAGQLTEEISALLDHTFDVQTVRGKCREYEAQGILRSEKQGRTLLYSLSTEALPPALYDAVAFFSEAAPLGEIGSFLLEGADVPNDTFRFKHHFIVHTLEDDILLELLQAMREKRQVRMVNFSQRSKMEYPCTGTPLKIFSSAVTGRRYVCLWLDGYRRNFVTRRLDYVASVELLAPDAQYDEKHAALENALPQVWGVSFSDLRQEQLYMKLWIDEETEGYVLERVQREGRGGSVKRLSENVYLYTVDLYDSSEILPWVKTFTGRILLLESSNPEVTRRFYSDMERMRRMYLPEGEADGTFQ